MTTNASKYRLVLGLEIHMHVKTSKKMFCGCDANIYDAEPNTHVCPTCLGLPGALPVPNKDAVIKTQLLGTTLNCRLNYDSKFDRKHYFYPDLPKGYQISQYKQPLCEEGFFELSNGTKVEIERIHLEEDTAKSIHEDGKSLINFNKSGMALIELVTKPSFASAQDASEFARILRDTVRYMGISEADMEKGQMRIEPNISVRTAEMETLGKLPDYKVEVKNINSFKFMEKAVEYEFNRQVELLEQGKTPAQENRGWNEKSQKTVAQRSKEDAHDYRYFPEPDIPPLKFDDEYFELIQSEMPEIPYKIRERLLSQYSLDENTANTLSTYPGLELLPKFEEICALNLEPQIAANLLINRVDYKDLSPDAFIAKYKDENNKIDDASELENIVKKVISENEKAVEDFRNGKDTALKFLMGQVMRETKGKASPEISQNLLEKAING